MLMNELDLSMRISINNFIFLLVLVFTVLNPVKGQIDHCDIEKPFDVKSFFRNLIFVRIIHRIRFD